MASRCCNEHNCRRSKPVMLMRGGLSGAWYVVTDYDDLGEGRYRAKAKHRLPDDAQRQLNEMAARDDGGAR